MVEEQEYHHDGHERSKCQRAACCLLAFELSAVFDVVSFRQFDLCVYLEVLIRGTFLEDSFTMILLFCIGSFRALLRLNPPGKYL